MMSCAGAEATEAVIALRQVIRDRWKRASTKMIVWKSRRRIEREQSYSVLSASAVLT